MSNLKKLINFLPQTGRIDWISFRPEKREKVEVTDTIDVTTSEGIIGDHYSGKNGKRQVTLIQAEHLEVVAKLLGKTQIDPTLTRRNIIVSGINLLALNNQQFQIGNEVILEMTGHCHPCSRMEQNLGAGGYNAMRGHGGITARVLKGGKIKINDKVKLLPSEVL